METLHILFIPVGMKVKVCNNIVITSFINFSNNGVLYIFMLIYLGKDKSNLSHSCIYMCKKLGHCSAYCIVLKIDAGWVIEHFVTNSTLSSPFIFNGALYSSNLLTLWDILTLYTSNFTQKPSSFAHLCAIHPYISVYSHIAFDGEWRIHK